MKFKVFFKALYEELNYLKNALGFIRPSLCQAFMALCRPDAASMTALTTRLFFNQPMMWMLTLRILPRRQLSICKVPTR